MRRYLLRRVVAMLPVLLGVVTVVFLALRLIPGDPARRRHRPGAGRELRADHRADAGGDAHRGGDRPANRVSGWHSTSDAAGVCRPARLAGRHLDAALLDRPDVDLLA